MTMRYLIKNLEWKPSTVSWFSFVLLGLIVAGIGLSGTAHVVNYLEERLAHHGIEHTQEIAAALLPELASTLESGLGPGLDPLARVIKGHTAPGFRILIIDRQQEAIILDSEGNPEAPVQLAKSWLAGAVSLDGTWSGLPLQGGAARALGTDRHPMLIWLQEMSEPEPGRWLLGVARDQKTLTEFMGDLHWHLDAVLLLTYVLITFLGYYAMRSIGRTYERSLESQVRERTRELEAAHEEMLHKARLATIGQTASVLTHEMRSPLASIKLALSGLKGSDRLQDRERHRVDLVLGEVDRLDGLLSEALDYVRPVKLSAKPVLPDHLLEQVLKQQEPLLDHKGIRLKREECSDCIAIHLDSAQMHQVLLNLLMNAVEASPEGGEIGISLRNNRGDLLLEISNGGEPMSQETLERAFEPFFTTKPKGTGLGLVLVKRVVEEHGGSVELTSNAAVGTRVTLHLPGNLKSAVDRFAGTISQ